MGACSHVPRWQECAPVPHCREQVAYGVEAKQPGLKLTHSMTVQLSGRGSALSGLVWSVGVRVMVAEDSRGRSGVRPLREENRRGTGVNRDTKGRVSHVHVCACACECPRF